MEICTSGAAVMYALLRRGTIATCWRRRKALAEVPLSGLLKTIGVTFLKTIGVTFLIFAFFKLRAGARTWHCLFDVCVCVCRPQGSTTVQLKETPTLLMCINITGLLMVYHRIFEFQIESTIM